MGDRLAFNNGIVVLSIVATLVFVAFGGNTSSLIPLYAVDVFLAFTLSQAGMVVVARAGRALAHEHCHRRGRMRNGSDRVPHRRRHQIHCRSLGVAVIVVACTTVALLTRRHFDRVDDATTLKAPATRDGESEQTPSQVSNLAIVPIPRLDHARRPSRRQPRHALRRAIRQHQHQQPPTRSGARFPPSRWGQCKSSFSVIPPVVACVESLHAQRPELTVTVIVPDLAVRHWWQRPLHR
jgi:hypothetical protein